MESFQKWNTAYCNLHPQNFLVGIYQEFLEPLAKSRLARKQETGLLATAFFLCQSFHGDHCELLIFR